MEQARFPLLNAAKMRVTALDSERVFSAECIGLSTEERDQLIGFFLQMQGRFGSFAFEAGGVRFELCRFNSDTGPSMEAGDGPHRLVFPIKVLPASKKAFVN